MLLQQPDGIQPEKWENIKRKKNGKGLHEDKNNWEPAAVLASPPQSWSLMQRIQKETLLQELIWSCGYTRRSSHRYRRTCESLLAGLLQSRILKQLLQIHNPRYSQVNEPSIDGGARLKPENGLFVVGSALWPCGLGGTFSLEIEIVNRILYSRDWRCVKVCRITWDLCHQCYPGHTRELLCPC